jgi:hypothetical protein
MHEFTFVRAAGFIIIRFSEFTGIMGGNVTIDICLTKTAERHWYVYSYSVLAAARHWYVYIYFI